MHSNRANLIHTKPHGPEPNGIRQNWRRLAFCSAENLLKKKQLSRVDPGGWGANPFIVGLRITQAVLGFTKGSSIKLQGKYVDIARAHHDIEQVKSTLLNARRNVESIHKSIYGNAKRVAATVGIEESAPCLASRQQHRTNIHADNCIQYYQRNLKIPLLDHLIAELNSRFDPVSSQHVIELMNLLPSTIPSSQHHDFENILKIYGDDLPSSKRFPSELHLWQHKWSSQAEVASVLNTPEKALKHADGDFFPNI